MMKSLVFPCEIAWRAAVAAGWHPRCARYIGVINTLSDSDLELEHGFADILLQHELVSRDARVRGVLCVRVEHLKHQRVNKHFVRQFLFMFYWDFGGKK